MSECTSSRRFTGCVLTSTYTTASTYLSTGTANFGANVSGALYFPLDAMQYGATSFAPSMIEFRAYNLTGMYIRVSGSGSMTSVSSGVRLGYYSETGDVMWTDISNTTLTLVTPDPMGTDSTLYRLGLDATMVLGLPYEDSSRMFSTMHDLYGVLVGARASLVGLGAGHTVVGYETSGDSTVVTLSRSKITPLLTTCVPLTLRTTVRPPPSLLFFSGGV